MVFGFLMFGGFGSDRRCALGWQPLASERLAWGGFLKMYL